MVDVYGCEYDGAVGIIYVLFKSRDRHRVRCEVLLPAQDYANSGSLPDQLRATMRGWPAERLSEQLLAREVARRGRRPLAVAVVLDEPIDQWTAAWECEKQEARRRSAPAERLSRADKLLSVLGNSVSRRQRETWVGDLCEDVKDRKAMGWSERQLVYFVLWQLIRALAARTFEIARRSFEQVVVGVVTKFLTGG